MSAIAAVNGSARTELSQPVASFWALTLGSIGVVYGDIGTSPLYAFREAVNAATGAGGAAGEPVVLGVLSLIIWALHRRRHRQIRRVPAARRQQRRRRHARADGAGAARRSRAAADHLSALSAARCFTATPSSRRRCRCSRRSKV